MDSTILAIWALVFTVVLVTNIHQCRCEIKDPLFTTFPYDQNLLSDARLPFLMLEINRTR